jgi:hypothetical protein
MSRVKSVLVPALTIIMISCTWASRRVNLGEQFSMRPKEEVSVVDTGITIRYHRTVSLN